MNFLRNPQEALEISSLMGLQNINKLLSLALKKNTLPTKPKSSHIRIKMLCDWCSSKDLCDDWNRMCQGNYRWNNIEITWENWDVDYFVIINKPQPNEFFIPEKTVIFHMEPWCGDSNQSWGVKTWGEWAKPDEFKFLQVRSHENFYNNCFWQLKLTYNDFKNIDFQPLKLKQDRISTICSSKYFDPGHIKRIDFIKFIETKNDPDVIIDIYNTDNIHQFKNYMGPHPKGEKDVGIVPYKYYFMGENNEEYNFMTEKIWEPLLTESLCFYWGCPNITDYIDKDAFVLLDLNDFEKSFETVKKAITENWWEKRLDIIRKEKQKVLEYYNFFPTMERLLKEFNLGKNSTKNEIIYNKYLKNYFNNYNLSTQNPLKICFIHSCNLNNDLTILESLLTRIEQVRFDFVIINNIGMSINLDLPKNYLLINSTKNIQNYEIPTIKLLHSFSSKFPNSKICYLHTKGISYDNTQHQNIKDWTEYMLHCNIDKYPIALTKLEDYDTVGCNISQAPKPHYSGNFWWANGSYINKLNTELLETKHDAEFWLLNDKCVKSYNIYSSGINHYLENFEKEKYLLDVFSFNNNKYQEVLLFLKKYQSSAWLGHLEFAMWLVNRFRPQIVLELGVDWAHSTFAFSSEGIGKIYGIDCFEGDIHAGHRNTFEIVKNVYQELLNTKLLPRDNIHFIKGYFDDVAKTWKDDDKIDILHIDGLHTYEAVKNDFETWFPKTSEDAIVLFHDVYAFKDSVGKYFDELEYPKTRVYHSAGLGILSRNREIIDMVDKYWVTKLYDPNRDNCLIHKSYNLNIDKVF